MEAIWTYLLQSTVSVILLYAVYWLFLKRDTFFSVNRVYLVASIIFSLAFPLFRWNLFIRDESAAYVYLLETITISPGVVKETVEANLTAIRVITIAYLTGVALFSIRFLFQLVQVYQLILKFGIRRERGMRLVFTDRNYQPFSFFRLVFIPDSLKDAGILPEVIEHERVHVRQAHSADLILLEVLTIVQWFNPVIWLYRRSLKSVHEYLADEGVLVRGYDPAHYRELLLNQSLGIQVNDLTNNFNHSLLKNRMIMMTKTRSRQIDRWKAALAIPVAMALVMAFSVSVNLSMGQEEPKKAQVAEKPAPPPPPPAAGKELASDEKVYQEVKFMPEFPGGMDGLVKYMMANVKYPEEAKKKGITGTVYVSFVVEKTGKVTKPALMKGAEPSLDAEALRVISGMPNWKPGRNDEGKAVNVQFNLPVKFALDGKPKAEEKK